ncbi:C-terminal binding protein [Glutamicibacter sp. NPDC087344]|uniref:C-terminal binding protein n=1 Tax=Glutamicibacter sp. NPDC087344 TaxID=3363994 RepID=UPI0038182526
MSLKILITDCDHDSTEVELQVARAAGIELEVAQCRSEDDVIAAAAGFDGIVVQYAPITARVLDALPQLKAIGRYGVGVDTLDVPAATERGVLVCNVPDYGTEDVSDHAIALALTLARGTARLDREVRAGNFSLESIKPLHRFNSRVFGVFGLGLIGAATARKAKGLGYEVIGFDPVREPGTVTEEGVAVVSREELLQRADVISLHVPLNTHTHHLVNDEFLSAVKDGAVLINTCRGGVVDTQAVVRALESGKLYGAGLDVFEQEPLPADAPILRQPNAVLTPHAAWYSEESYTELKSRTVQNIADYLLGRTPRNIYNPDALKLAAKSAAN